MCYVCIALSTHIFPKGNVEMDLRSNDLFWNMLQRNLISRNSIRTALDLCNFTDTNTMRFRLLKCLLSQLATWKYERPACCVPSDAYNRVKAYGVEIWADCVLCVPRDACNRVKGGWVHSKTFHKNLANYEIGLRNIAFKTELVKVSKL
jgi:hypothetical protein